MRKALTDLRGSARWIAAAGVGVAAAFAVACGLLGLVAGTFAPSNSDLTGVSWFGAGLLLSALAMHGTLVVTGGTPGSTEGAFSVPGMTYTGAGHMTAVAQPLLLALAACVALWWVHRRWTAQAPPASLAVAGARAGVVAVLFASTMLVVASVGQLRVTNTSDGVAATIGVAAVGLWLSSFVMALATGVLAQGSRPGTWHATVPQRLGRWYVPLKVAAVSAAILVLLCSGLSVLVAPLAAHGDRLAVMAVAVPLALNLGVYGAGVAQGAKVSFTYGGITQGQILGFGTADGTSRTGSVGLLGAHLPIVACLLLVVTAAVWLFVGGRAIRWSAQAGAEPALWQFPVAAVGLWTALFLLTRQGALGSNSIGGLLGSDAGTFSTGVGLDLPTVLAASALWSLVGVVAGPRATALLAAWRRQPGAVAAPAPAPGGRRGAAGGWLAAARRSSPLWAAPPGQGWHIAWAPAAPSTQRPDPTSAPGAWPPAEVPSGPGVPPDRPSPANRRPAPVTRWLARRTRRFWFSAGGTVAGIAVLVVGGLALLAWQASAHSPGRAATAYLRALASRDVAAMLQNAEIVPPTTEGTHDVTLLSPKDVRQELAASANAMGPIGNIRVVHSQVAGDQASVSVQYTARAQSITQTYTVIRATSPTGWAVQVYPGHLGISAPPGTTQVTVAGIPVPISGGTTTAYVFPASMSVDSLASPAFGATSTVADVALGQAQVTVSPPLAPGAATAITRLVTTQLNACLASGSLTPDNCPNSDDSFPCTEGDTCTNVQWQASGALGADLQVVDVDGDVTANGTLTAADTYLDSTPPTPYDSGSSITQTDGPTTWQYQYPVTYTGGRWTLGPVQASESY